jgi:glycosyltransferase involved in cell wall biosynthesis
MKLLIVAPQPFFTPRGTPFSVYYRTKVTGELGHDADLLTYGQGADVDIPGCRLVRIPKFAEFGQIPIGPSFLKLFLDCFMIVWTIGLLLRHRYDVVHAHEEAVFWCRWLKPVFRFRLIYDMHSSLPEQLDNFQYTRSRIIHWIFTKLEESAVRAADSVVVICPALRDHALTLTTDRAKVTLIENSLFDPVKLTHNDPGCSDRAAAGTFTNPTSGPMPGLTEWIASRSRERLISYAGTLEVYQGIDKLLDAFARVRESIPDAGLLIIGGTDSEVSALRDLAARLGLRDSAYFTGTVPQAKAQRLVSITAVSVSPRFAGHNTPMKIYQLMAAEVPLVATDIESHSQVLNGDIAILAEPTTTGLADAIIRALGDPQASRAMAARARAWYEAHYSRDVYSEKMRKLFEALS